MTSHPPRRQSALVADTTACTCPVNPTDETALLHVQLAKHYAELSRDAAGTGKPPSLWRAIAKAYGGPYVTATVLKLASDALAISQPQLLRALLRWIGSYKTGER